MCIYEEQTPTSHRVELPLGSRQLTLYAMRKFHSLSWLDFATFGKLGTGGWAKEEGLYCVVEKYELESEAFRVNYLQHEAQHFDDYCRFPGLKQGRQDILEFRAKLVELIYAESLTAFHRFMTEAKNDSFYPHLLASYQIQQALLRELDLKDAAELTEHLTDLSDLQRLSRVIFERNTQDLRAGTCWGEKLLRSALEP